MIDSLARTTLVGRPGFAWPTLALAVVAFGGFVGAGVAAAAGMVPWAVSVPVQAIAAYAGFTPLHDASHGAIARSRWVNAIAGWACGLPLLAAFPGFRYLHLAHHQFTNDPELDPDTWTGRARSRIGIAMRWMVMDAHYLARYLLEARSRPRAEVVSSGFGFVGISTAMVALVATGHAVELFACWLVPGRIALVTLSIVFDWIPHHPRRVRVAEDRYRATNVYEHRWLAPLLLGQNYHLVHHLYPGVPFYRYGHVYWAMRDELLAHGADVRRIGRKISSPSRAPATDATLRVAEIIAETPDTRTFVFEVPDALRATYAYRAGQFVVVHVPVLGGPPLRRCYSISRAPDQAAGSLAITVKRAPGGQASRWLHDHLRPGRALRVGAPTGRFVLAPGGERPLLLLAAGTGITPVIAILDEALRTTARRVKLVYANRDAGHVIFRARLDALARRHADRFELVLHLDSERGMLDTAAWLAHLDRAADLYVCGPAAVMDLVERAATTIGIAPERRFSERFTPRATATAAPGPHAASFTAIRHGRRHLVTLAAHDSMLEAARRAGLEPAASCEEGHCGTCAAQLACGRVDARALGPLTDGDLARGFILPCSARPLGPEPVVVDFDASPLDHARSDREPRGADVRADLAAIA